MSTGSKKDPTFMVTDEELVDDRSRFTVFFQIFTRKFWKLMTLNILTGIFNLPALAFMVFLGLYLLQVLNPESLVSGNSQDVMGYLWISYVPLLLVFLSIPAVTMGPAQAGLAYTLRNFTYENPTFLWHDFITKAKENLKQSLIVGTINVLLFIFALLDLYLYGQIAQGNLFLRIANGLLIGVFVIYLMMCLYIWPMMVTYRLTIRQLYKNAFLFAVGRFFPNLLVFILAIVASYGPFLLAALSNNVIAIGAAYLYQVLLGLTLPGLIIHFFVNPMMDKHMQPEEKEDTDKKNVE